MIKLRELLDLVSKGMMIPPGSGDIAIRFITLMRGQYSKCFDEDVFELMTEDDLSIQILTLDDRIVEINFY